MKDVLLNNYRIQGNWSEDAETIKNILTLLNRYDFFYRFINNYGQMIEQEEKNYKIKKELKTLGVSEFSLANNN
jgi:hypothetical protein